MKTKLHYLLPLLLLCCSCDWKPYIFYKRNVKVNDSVSVCGIENPIENLDWLNEIHKTYTFKVRHSSSCFVREISVYVVEATGDTIIGDYCHDSFYTKDKCYAYNCDGTPYDFGSIGCNRTARISAEH